MGLMGRTPDYVNVTFAGFAGREDEWAGNGNERGAANLVRYQKQLARQDLCLTHTIIHATIDRSWVNVPGAFDPVALHKVENTSHGILVRGSRILATLAPFANEIAILSRRADVRSRSRARIGLYRASEHAWIEVPLPRQRGDEYQPI